MIGTLVLVLAAPTDASRPADVASPPPPVSCFGANALASPGSCAPKTQGKLSPDPSKAAADKSQAYRGDGTHPSCVTHPPAFSLVRCDFNGSSSVHVALVGNSHAAQWFPAVARVAKAEHWHLTTYLGSQCALADVRQVWTPSIQNNCQHWVDSVTKSVSRGNFDLVMVADKTSKLAVGTHDLQGSFAPYYRGYRDVIGRMQAAHTRVTVIRDSPIPNKNIPACLTQHSTDYQACNGPRSTWLQPDPAAAAAESMHAESATVTDLSDRICGPDTCPAVVGGVPAYYDASHLTATFTSTLAPFLAPQLTHELAAPRS
jgi:hypothetical protein